MADNVTLGFPQMWFHPVNGSYKKCNNPDEIPDGFVENFTDATDPVAHKFHGPPKCTDFTVPGAEKKPAAKKAAPKAPEVKKPAAKAKAKPKAKAKAKPAAKAKPEPKAPTLKALKMSREEALEMLEEEEVEFDAEADDDAIAALVAPLLEDEDEE